MKRLMILITAVSLGQAAFAQSALKAGDFSASLGAQTFTANGNGGIAEFRNLFRDNTIIPLDIDTYTESAGLSFGGSGIVSLATSFYWKKKDQTEHTPNRALRLGVSFFGSYALHNSYYKTTETAIDTLYSSGGKAYPIDSVNFKSISLNSLSQNLVVDAALIFRTTSSKRWTLYAGMGMQLGLSVNPYAQVTMLEYNETELRDGGSLENEYRETTFTTHSRSLPSSLVASLYVPMGIDWQTGVKSEFFKQMHLFAEMRPSLLFSRGIVEGMDTNPGISGQLGVRIQFLNP